MTSRLSIKIAHYFGIMLMPKWIFDELLFADVQLAWNLIGGEVLKRFTGIRSGMQKFSKERL